MRSPPMPAESSGGRSRTQVNSSRSAPGRASLQRSPVSPRADRGLAHQPAIRAHDEPKAAKLTDVRALAFTLTFVGVEVGRPAVVRHRQPAVAAPDRPDQGLLDAPECPDLVSGEVHLPSRCSAHNTPAP